MPSNRLAPLPSWVGDPFWEILDPPLQKWVVPSATPKMGSTNLQKHQPSGFSRQQIYKFKKCSVNSTF